MNDNPTERGIFLVVMVGLLAYTSYLYGFKKGDDKPPVIVVETKYIDDKCICIEC